MSFGWKARHHVVLLAAGFGAYAFMESHTDWSEMHHWNRAFGDMSVVFIALSMIIGPLNRLSAVFRSAIRWRRELGIYGVVLAVVHTVIILAGHWVEWDLARLFGYELDHLTGVYVMRQHGLGLANAIGVIGLLYGIVLALASSDWSQRLLSGSVWKFLQRSAYVLWMLIVIHTAYFMYLHFQNFRTTVPGPNWAQIPFAWLVALVALVQLAAFLKTWRSKRGWGRKLAARERKTEVVAPPV